MFLTIWLDGTLEMMQNDVETSEFEYRSMEIHLFLDDVVWEQLFGEELRFLWNSFALDAIWTANEFGMSFRCERFWGEVWLRFPTPCAWCFSTISTECFLNWTAFCFWKLPNVFADVFDVLGIWWEDANGRECFWNNMVNSKKLNSPRLRVRRSLWRTFIFACRRCLFTTQSRPAGTREVQTCMLHVCMNQLHRQFTFVVFLCGKGNWVLQWQPSCFGEFALLNARRGVKPTPFDVRHATSGCN